MLKLFYHNTPNPTKVALLLEELAHPYEVVATDIWDGAQHTPEFRRINPNGKVPAIIDGDVVIFDSTAILLWLADRAEQFNGDTTSRPQMLSWLMFVASGLGPFCGQAFPQHSHRQRLRHQPLCARTGTPFLRAGQAPDTDPVASRV